MTENEKIIEILNSKPSQKIGLDDFYGKQTVINMLKEAINFTDSSLLLNNGLKVGDYVKNNIEEYRIVFIDYEKNMANGRIRHTNVIKKDIPLSQLTKIV